MAQRTEEEVLAAELEEDPRFGLRLLDMPAQYRELRNLREVLLFWISPVEKTNRRWKQTDARLALLTDTALYTMNDSAAGSITRCIPVTKIDRIIKQDQWINVVVQGVDEYDLRFRCNGDNPRQAYESFFTTLNRLYEYHRGRERPLPCDTFPDVDHVKTLLRLKKPPGWDLHIEGIRTRKWLARMVIMQRATEQKQREEARTKSEQTAVPLQEAWDREKNLEEELERTRKALRATELRSMQSERQRRDHAVQTDLDIYPCPTCQRRVDHTDVLEMNLADVPMAASRESKSPVTPSAQQQLPQAEILANQHTQGNSSTKDAEVSPAVRWSEWEVEKRNLLAQLNSKERENTIRSNSFEERNALRTQLAQEERRSAQLRAEMRKLREENDQLQSENQKMLSRGTRVTTAGLEAERDSWMTEKVALEGVVGELNTLRSALNRKEEELTDYRSMLLGAFSQQLNDVQGMREDLRQYDVQLLQHMAKVASRSERTPTTVRINTAPMSLETPVRPTRGPPPGGTTSTRPRW